jgi:hypothetical protein
VDLVLLDPEYMRQRPGGVCHCLAGVVNSQFVTIPGDGRGVRLDRIVIVSRRRVVGIHPVRRRRQGRLRVPDFHFQRLAHE